MTTPASLEPPKNGTTSRSSYPIGFSLRDDSGQAVLAITDDPSEQHMHLEIVNVARAAIGLDELIGEAGAADHHFQLRFRPGVLSARSLGKAQCSDDDWSIVGPQPIQDGSGSDVAIYLLSKKLRTLDVDAPIRLALPQLSAAGGIGAQGTPIELRYHNLRLNGDPLDDSALFHLDLVNQRGRQDIPLHVGFAGSNTILNEHGAANELTLRITNASQSDLALSGKGSSAPSKFIISFDVGDDCAIAELSQAREIVPETIDSQSPVILQPGNPPKPDAHADWEVRQDTQGQSPAWILTALDKTSLPAGRSIEIRLTHIITSLPAGQTNLYLRYENIPGYRDGQFVATIEKGPILYDAKGNVGVGTAPSNYTLDVKGTAHVSGDVAWHEIFFMPTASGKTHLLAGTVKRNSQGFVESLQGSGFNAHQLGGFPTVDAIEVRLFNQGVAWAALLFYIALREDGTPIKTEKVEGQFMFRVLARESFSFMAVVLRQ